MRQLVRWSMTVCLLWVGSLTVARSDFRLVEAVKRQDINAIRALLKQGVDVNTAEGDGLTALHWAAHRSDLETVDRLIQLGANVNAATDLGVMPLSLASLNGNAAIVNKLLSAGANPNAVMSGESALMTGARTGDVDVVKALLVRGANVNAKEPTRRQTALMWAAAQGHADVVRVLIEAGADLHARSLSYPMRVSFGGRSDNPGAIGTIEKGGSTPVLFVARGGDVESARLLLAAGANVSDATPDGMSALTIAVRSGHSALAKLLIDHGADLDANAAGYTALHAAVLVGDPGIVKELIAHRANLNIQITGGEPVRRGSMELSLATSLAGATPFLLAAKYAEVEMMRMLAAAGADSRTPMKNGTTPLLAAAGFGWVAGADFEGDRRGVNSYESYEGRSSAEAEKEEKETLDAVTVMFSLGADVNEADLEGNTALFGAAAKGFDSVVQLLVERGANVNAVNKRGQTPLNVTSGRRRGGGHQRTAVLLWKLGAKEQLPTAPIPRISSEADYGVAMKEVAMLGTTLRKAVASASEDDAANAAARLETFFNEIQTFWAARGVEDATTEARNALAAAQAVSKAVAAGDMDTAGLAVQKLNGTCTACHIAHRERLPDGTFKIK